MTLSPAVLDVILLGVAAEAVALVWWLQAVGRREASLPTLLFLGSGAFLLMAVRVAWSGGAEGIIAILLLGAGVLHVACLKAAFAIVTRSR